MSEKYLEQVRRELNALKKAIETLPEAEMEKVVRMARVISETIERGNMVFTCGNGGSAADAQHIAGELVGRFRRKKISGYRAVSLTVNSSVVTALANDYSWEEVFSRQLDSMAAPGDVLLALSTSGNSPNTVKALEKAVELGMIPLVFSGGEGGKMSLLAREAFIVPDEDFARIQEIHMTVGHILCGLVEEILTGG